jgi:hypothetical protein
MQRALAIAVVTLALAGVAPARAAGPPVIEETVVAPAPDPITSLLHTQVGSWQCTIDYPGLRDSERFVVVWSGFGDHYIRGTADVPPFRQEPERKINVILGYDTTAKQWTNAFTDSTGAFALYKSASGAAGKKIALTQAYPDDSDIGPSVVVLGPRTTTIDNSWKVSGAQRESHEVCAKIPV